MLEWHNSMPKVGDTIAFEQFEFTILTVDERRIKRIRVEIKDAKKSEKD